MLFLLLHPDSQLILYNYLEKCLDGVLIVMSFISETQEVVYNHLSSSLVASRYGRRKKTCVWNYNKLFLHFHFLAFSSLVPQGDCFRVYLSSTRTEIHITRSSNSFRLNQCRKSS